VNESSGQSFWLEVAADAQRYARQLCHHQGSLAGADGADIAQMVVLSVFRRSQAEPDLLQRLMSNDRLRHAFIKEATRLTWQNLLRKSRKQERQASEDSLAAAPAPQPPDDGDWQSEVTSAIQDDEYAALAFRRILEMESLEEFAARKGVSLRTAQRAFVLGCGRLRGQLEQLWGMKTEENQ